MKWEVELHFTPRHLCRQCIWKHPFPPHLFLNDLVGNPDNLIFLISPYYLWAIISYRIEVKKYTILSRR